ncbi:hypothetical protein K435DRAFT_802257 [Dendrothele bispora CBS 962.96]|uniref:DUF6533 domain-containing protein n=1 Tax=Dendrothele bispora (strain CBS 962.96) TaxID=1314807 RepID=A0A4S8LN22_DENBC|nr:hypothetical protein K435DRAFT_802257 [Dendrothele bispora CBS 962.96]
MSSTLDLRTIAYLGEIRGVLTSEVASLTLLVYDYFLTLVLSSVQIETEIRLVWRAPWKPGKFLYFLTRYLAFAGAIAMMYLDSARFLSLETCKTLSRMLSFLTFIELYIAECSHPVLKSVGNLGKFLEDSVVTPLRISDPGTNSRLISVLAYTRVQK